ncbi:serine/threonine-protein phosphatase [Streptomyces sp. MUM 203J]|uniref:PP2C family protein-serine/threonine phosphatase n=1 Tax=Streptomyces sp. MUM 203J TaxID=2791990 RepID=UPI001F04C690|nr:PP2C family protein-serine/threonine phosphatase [Streptomyces sp. MUM 203J]MCH0539085.1 serine/threonine-protein phosphatase [Streptomyces sp. MUM 203J]
MEGAERALPGARPQLWVRLMPWLLVAAVLLAQLLTPETVQLEFAFAVIAPLTSLVYGVLGTSLVSATAIGVLIVPEVRSEHFSDGDLVSFGLIAAASAFLAWVRARRDAQLVSVRSVAEAAQLAVLPPLPARVGAVRCGALYRAAERSALVGGDLYDVQPGPYGVRAIVADVQGHGLSAVGTVAALLGTFREAVLDEPELAGVAARLDRRLVVDGERLDEGGELFATAVLMEFPDGAAREVRVVSCGHPPPLVVDGHGVREVALEYGPPLGLGLADFRAPDPAAVPLAPTDVLLAHTDGVTEARDAEGVFYPLITRIPLERDPAALVRAVWRDLSSYAGEVVDDVALLALSVSRGE